MLNNLEKAEVTYPTYSTPFENQSVYNMRSVINLLIIQQIQQLEHIQQAQFQPKV